MLLVGARPGSSSAAGVAFPRHPRGAGTASLILKGLLELATPRSWARWPACCWGIGSSDRSARARSSRPRPCDRRGRAGRDRGRGGADRVRIRPVARGALRARRRWPVPVGGSSVLWEPIVLVLAAAAYYELSSRGSSVFGGGGRRVDSLVLLFPVLLLAGGSGLFARVVLGGRFLRSVAPRLPTPAWLAAGDWPRAGIGPWRWLPEPRCRSASSCSPAASSRVVAGDHRRQGEARPRQRADLAAR